MTAAVHHPERYCPICGQRLPADHELEHHCQSGLLESLDHQPQPRPVAVPDLDERLTDGFRQFAEDQSDDADDLADVLPECSREHLQHWF